MKGQKPVGGYLRTGTVVRPHQRGVPSPQPKPRPVPQSFPAPKVTPPPRPRGR